MRHFVKASSFGLVAVAVLMSSCMSDRAAKEFQEGITAPFNEIARNMRCSQDLTYATLAFYRKNERWPKDYSELSGFVAQSEGLLVLKKHEQVNFSESHERVLRVSFIPADFVAIGLTNAVLRFTLSPKDAETK